MEQHVLSAHTCQVLAKVLFPSILIRTYKVGTVIPNLTVKKTEDQRQGAWGHPDGIRWN